MHHRYRASHGSRIRANRRITRSASWYLEATLPGGSGGRCSGGANAHRFVSELDFCVSGRGDYSALKSRFTRQSDRGGILCRQKRHSPAMSSAQIGLTTHRYTERTAGQPIRADGPQIGARPIIRRPS